MCSISAIRNVKNTKTTATTKNQTIRRSYYCLSHKTLFSWRDRSCMLGNSRVNRMGISNTAGIARRNVKWRQVVLSCAVQWRPLRDLKLAVSLPTYIPMLKISLRHQNENDLIVIIRTNVGTYVQKILRQEKKHTTRNMWKSSSQ